MSSRSMCPISAATLVVSVPVFVPPIIASRNTWLDIITLAWLSWRNPVIVRAQIFLARVVTFLELELIQPEVLERMIRDLSGAWRCLECGFAKLRKLAVVSHIQANHISFEGYTCNLCNMGSKTILALQRHQQRFHKQ